MGVAEALETVRAGIDALLAADLESVTAREMVEVVRAVEVQARRLDAARVAQVEVIDRRGLHAEDGHYSARVMVRHLAGLSEGEAARRARTSAVLRDLPGFRAAYEAGEVGTCHMARVARVHANPRVRDKLPDCEEVLLEQAKTLPASDFCRVMSYWERLADEDGTIRANQRGHDNRDARFIQDPIDGTWKLIGRFGALDGAIMREILERYLEAERLADWDKARAEYGDDAAGAHLERTEAQRRADAVKRIFADAASAPEGATGPTVTVDIVMDHDTFQRQLIRMAGGTPQPPDPCDPHHRCSTLNGHLVDPFEAAIAAFVHSVRRVVVDGQGTVIDLGPRRFFTGNSRLAVLLQSERCVWPGCGVPVTACQADHLRPHSHGGRTDPANGAPLCGRHNRHKHKGRYTIRRDPDGRWHTYRPDGTEI